MSKIPAEIGSLFPRKRRHGVEVSDWSRAEENSIGDPGVLLATWLGEELARRPGAKRVSFDAEELRENVALVLGRKRVPGAEVTDNHTGVRYRVTLDMSAAEPSLRTVEIVPTKLPADERVFRVPVGSLVQEVLTLRSLKETIGVDLIIGARGGGQPTPEQLLMLLKQEPKLTRSEIGAIYGKTAARVYQWIQSAKKARPDLEWPDSRPNQFTKKEFLG